MNIVSARFQDTFPTIIIDFLREPNISVITEQLYTDSRQWFLPLSELKSGTFAILLLQLIFSP